ncbi:MAG: hypothetical protein Q9210_004463 [Variospora velana]
MTLLLLIECILAAPPDRNTLSNKNVFGTPDPADCAQAMFWIPYLNAPASTSQDAKAPWLFSEPQFQNPPFKKTIKN